MLRTTGQYITTASAGERFQSFVPDPLPEQSYLELTPRHYELMEKANWALGRLDGVAALLPDTSLFLYFYIRKEALLSSQIEGTQSSFSVNGLISLAVRLALPCDCISICNAIRLLPFRRQQRIPA